LSNKREDWSVWVIVMNAEVLSLNCPTRLASPRVDYDAFFDTALDGLRDERRYRVFADLERLAGRFPYEFERLAPSSATDR
jgi:hypothetical protein